MATCGGQARALEVLPRDEVQRPLLQPKPDDALPATERDASLARFYGGFVRRNACSI